jgi:hypothetical protein
MEDIKKLVFIAGKVQETLARCRHGHYLELLNQLKTISDHLTEIAGQSRKLAVSLSRGWLAAAEICSSNIRRSLDDLSYHISRYEQLADRQNGQVLKLSAIVEDLKQLQDDFEKIDFDKQDNAICVTTEPITLDDVYLGPFEIRLELNRLQELHRVSTYFCTALDPHPASVSEDVPHPHVSGKRLCEGDGAPAIRAALEQGRLCDFFTIVNGILNNYSPDSPYVPLEDWDGEPCRDCGSVMNSEDSYYCHFCDEQFCDQCSRSCNGCLETVCNNCSQVCASCQEGVCPNCISECEGCHSLLCYRCVEEGLCPNCEQERKAEDERLDQDNKTTGTCEAASATQSQPAGAQTGLSG